MRLPPGFKPGCESGAQPGFMAVFREAVRGMKLGMNHLKHLRKGCLHPIDPMLSHNIRVE